MKIAVIPARGGSKRIPRKNIWPFCGRPITAWSIQAALESQCFDRVVVSTDDEEIAEVAVSCGAEVPFMRPQHLADDHTGATPVMAHAVAFCGLARSDLACCVYATAPFVSAAVLREGHDILLASGAEFAFSITSYAFPIQRAVRLSSNNRIEMMDPSNFEVRSQDLEEAWHDAGQFYWGKARAWRSAEILFSAVSAPVPIPRYRVQDIDTEPDWVRAKLLFQAATALEGRL